MLYDFHLGLAADPKGEQIAFVLVKITYTFDQAGMLRMTDPEPLHNNIFDPNESPRLKPGCDFWPYKLATDIVVQGKAHAPMRRPIQSTTLSVHVGRYEKHALVFGDRFVLYNGRQLRFSEPEPFESVDLTCYNAYGGVDWRVPIENEQSLVTQIRLQADHPGLYPRNPYGTGYVVLSDHEDVDGMELPNVEDPEDLLTPERLITGDPRKWHLQPLPCIFDWQQGHVFPRCAFFGGADGWHPAPEDAVAEVRMGILPKNYRSIFNEQLTDRGPDPRFFNEASSGLQVPYLKGDEKVLLRGFHPDGDINVQLLDGPPQIQINIEGHKHKPQPRLHTLLIKPEDKRVCMLWAAHVRTPRMFIEGIHITIPIECSINGGNPIAFKTPLPIAEALKKAQNA